MKIVNLKAAPSKQGGSIITFNIKNVSDVAIQLGSELGSTGKPYTNIRFVYDRQAQSEAIFFMPFSKNLIAKPCHGPQEFQSVSPDHTIPVNLEVHSDWGGKKLALVLATKDGEFVAGTFVVPKK